MLNLDTNIIIFAAMGHLTASEKVLLAAHDDWAISPIVLWEITKLHQLKRLVYSLEDRIMKAYLERMTLLPINEIVCANLYKLDFRSDPADEIIAATSLALNIPLMTRDKKINKSKIVPLAK